MYQNMRDLLSVLYVDLGSSQSDMSALERIHSVIVSVRKRISVKVIGDIIGVNRINELS